MNVMQKVIVFLIVTTYVSPCSGVLTLLRLDRRVSALENDLQDEIKYRQEDVQHLTSMIDNLEESVQSKHGALTELQANSHGANMTFLNIINKAFSDEKMMNSRTRRKVAGVEKSISEFANMVSSSTNIQTQLNIIVEALKNQSEITSALQHNQLETIEEISTLKHNIQDIKYLLIPKSCQEIHARGFRVSGIYKVYHDSHSDPESSQLDVYCDMKTDGGGWTVFQRRQDGSEDFYRNWSDYEQGFGHLDGEFWLGNMYLSQLTKQCCHELRIDLEDFRGNRRYAKYSKFQIGSTDQNYVLTADGYSGDAGDSMEFHNGNMFSTKDRDNDRSKADSCAQAFKGAWWYNNCHHSHLNGIYYKEGQAEFYKGINWYHWLWHSYSLKYADMKFR